MAPEGYSKQLWTSGAILIREKPFTLKSGRESCIYVNHRNLVCVPDSLQSLASFVVSASEPNYPAPFAFANVDSSVSPYLTAACSLAALRPFYNVRVLGHEKGLKAELFRYDETTASRFPPTMPAVLLDDVVTTMSTLELTASILERNGINVLGAACLLDRRVSSDIERTEMAISSVASLREILEYGQANGHIAPENRSLIDVELNTLDS